MSVQTPSAPTAPSFAHSPTSPHPVPIPAPADVYVRTDPACGRTYHAARALPENADLLGPCTPYAYTLWKRFRNEVCAECWRYERGRRAFLTRRDDDGDEGGSETPASGATAEASPENRRADAKAVTTATATTGAGLWFCDAECQRRWLVREGVGAVELLRQLEGARQRKSPKNKNKESKLEREMTQAVADAAWAAVRAQESSPREVRRWRELRLDDYETDMARYVLLALLCCCRERAQSPRSPSPREPGDGDQDQDQDENKLERDAGWREDAQSNPEGGYGQGSEWRAFCALQTNELSLLQACPEILEHQTRIYRLLKGTFGHDTWRARSSGTAASSPPGLESSAGARVKEAKARPYGLAELGSVISIGNVRRILGVDPGNAFGIWEVPLMEESECLGFALYPTASLFNHHCSPNVRKEREGRSLRFLTTRPVGEGEEVCISYGHVERMGLAERRAELLEGWYFRCRCSRCVAEESG